MNTPVRADGFTDRIITRRITRAGHRQLTAFLCAAAFAVPLLADPEPPPGSGGLALPDLDRPIPADQTDLVLGAPEPVARIETDQGVTLEFIEVEPGVMALVEGGPVGVESPVPEALSAAISPVELFLSLAPRYQPVPEELQRASARVAEKGQWEDLRMSGLAIDDAGPGESDPGSDPAAKGSSWCEQKTYSMARASNYKWADRATNLGGSYRYRALYDDSTWTGSDKLAVIGVVCGIDGLVHWNLTKQNCKACSWTSIKSFWVPGGYWYRWYYYNKKNDFNYKSKVTAFSEGGSRFTHRVSTCRDYHSRTIWTSSLAAGCRLNASYPTSEGFYWQGTEYYGVDPSNIYTPSSRR